jgi:hypothetical protein
VVAHAFTDSGFVRGPYAMCMAAGSADLAAGSAGLAAHLAEVVRLPRAVIVCSHVTWVVLALAACDCGRGCLRVRLRLRHSVFAVLGAHSIAYRRL